MVKTDMIRVALVIPGCIYPDSNVPMLALKDGKIRREQYISALKFYIEKCNVTNIIFCDNSAAEVDLELIELANKNHKKFEWISFRGNSEMTISKGKGYGEGEILEHIFSHSQLIHQCDVIVKITGRMIVRNINQILRFCNGEKMYTYPLQKTHDYPFISTKMYIMRKIDYSNYFLKAYLAVDDFHNFFLEMAFANTVIKNKLSHSVFPISPQIEGVSGTTGEVYKNTFYTQIKSTLRMHWKNLKTI